jgi:transcriptional regulator with XRE-family HTH domain
VFSATRVATDTLQQRFGKLVRRLRLDAALSQEDLADRASLHPTYVSRLERGARMPSLLVLTKLATGFGMTLTELMGQFEQGGDTAPAGQKPKRKKT